MKLLLVILLCCGCTTMQVNFPDDYSASYTRWGDQQIQGFKFVKNELGVISVELEKQSSDAKVLDVISALAGAAK